MGRARRAMELLALAGFEGVIHPNERERAIAAARDILQDEFWDVSLSWSTAGWTTDCLMARGPGGPDDVCYWADVMPSWRTR